MAIDDGDEDSGVHPIPERRDPTAANRRLKRHAFQALRGEIDRLTAEAKLKDAKIARLERELELARGRKK